MTANGNPESEPDSHQLAHLTREGSFAVLFKRAAHDILPERTADILVTRYGLADGRSHTLAHIGEQYGLSRERVRQLVNKGLGRLQRRAATERRRGDTEASCAKLAAYVRDAVIPGETGEFERLFTLLADDLPHLKPAGEAAPLVASFLGPSKEASRYVLMIKALTDDQVADHRQASKGKHGQERLYALLQDVIWPPEIRLVETMLSAGIQPPERFHPARVVKWAHSIAIGWAGWWSLSRLSSANFCGDSMQFLRSPFIRSSHFALPMIAMGQPIITILMFS